jgi:dihydroorotate dehydrogenase (NAD+) catalytic subunit
MIELAPHNPYGLALQSPVIVAPGCALSLRELDPASIGAVVTRRAVIRPVIESRNRWSTTPAGIVFERLPTVKLRALLETDSKRWARSPVPVLLCLSGSADELGEMAARLEFVESLAGLVLEVQADQAAFSVSAVRDQTALPLLVIVPVGNTSVAAPCVNAGADALVVQAYPPAAAVVDGAAFDGVLVGPALVPSTLLALRTIAAEVTVPLVALGGVADPQIARQCMATGASAVMVDGALYGDPSAPQHIGRELGRNR